MAGTQLNKKLLLSCKRLFSSTGNTPTEKLFSAVVLERLPVVLPDTPAWALDFQTLSFSRNQENRKEYPSEFLDLGTAATAYADGDIAFEPGPRVTEADKKNDVRSTDRALDKRLFLLVKGKAGEGKWHFPMKPYEDEETMRLCAEAALHSNLGKHLETYFVGNAPCGHLENSETNTKVFFFRSQILGGNLKLNQQLKDYAWVTKEQITDFIEPQHLDFFNKLLI